MKQKKSRWKKSGSEAWVVESHDCWDRPTVNSSGELTDAVPVFLCRPMEWVPAMRLKAGTEHRVEIAATQSDELKT